MTRAVCMRCGHDKGRHDATCPTCGHRPEADGLLVAWLLSDAHLDEAELDRVAVRIKRGEQVRPSTRQLDTARKGLGTHASSDPGLPPQEVLGLAAMGVLLTPLPGLVAWWWWRVRRPKAARQALWVSAPASLLFWLAVVVLWMG